MLAISPKMLKQFKKRLSKGLTPNGKKLNNMDHIEKIKRAIEVFESQQKIIDSQKELIESLTEQVKKQERMIELLKNNQKIIDTMLG